MNRGLATKRPRKHIYYDTESDSDDVNVPSSPHKKKHTESHAQKIISLELKNKLIQAVRIGDVQTIDSIHLQSLNDNFTPLLNICTDRNFHLIHEAAFHGQLSTVQYFVEHLKADPSMPSYREYTPLHSAAWHGNLSICEYLIKKNADINAINFFNTTPLHIAAHRGHLPTVRQLLAHNAAITIKTKNSYAARNGLTPLTTALKAIAIKRAQCTLSKQKEHRYEHIIRLLKDKIFQYHAQDPEAQCPICLTHLSEIITFKRHVLLCCNNIACSDCVSLCSTCPLCREKIY